VADVGSVDNKTVCLLQILMLPWWFFCYTCC